MFRTISFQNFKSWKDTGAIELAPITGFFGSNSSGKSTILQFFLLLKQTIESSDRNRVLHTGDERSYVDLGTFYDIAYNHTIPSSISFNLEWDLLDKLKILNPEGSKKDVIFSLQSLKFVSKIQLEKDSVFVDSFRYEFKSASKIIDFEFNKKANSSEYELKAKGYRLKRVKGRVWPLPAPIKNYGFPDQASGYFQNTGFLSDFVLAYEKVFQSTYYLGPLREYPKRSYSWAGEQPQDVGRRGELAVPALLASRKLPKIGQGRGKKQITIEERIALWLKELRLIDDFNVQAIAKNRKEYEVQVRRFCDTSKVLITDVGFGVSQVLPVLVLCYYAPEGSTIILEQPEIHLHPSVQAGLADVFIDTIKTRKIQIIVESHSEHLLRRLQRRIAEEKEGLTNQDIKLYFCRSTPDGSSNLDPLEIDNFGNIANWPEHFFGDEMEDLLAMTEAAMKRQMEHE